MVPLARSIETVGVNVPTRAPGVRSQVIPTHTPVHLLSELLGVVVVCGVLLGPLPLSAAALAGGLFALLLARPQTVLLAGLAAVPLSGASPHATSTLLVFVAMLALSCGRHLLEGSAQRPAVVTVALPLLALWVAMSVMLTPAGPTGAISRSELIQPLVGAAVAVGATLFPIQPRELALAAVPGALLVSLSVIQGSIGLDGRVRALGLNPDYLATLIVLMLAAMLVGGRSTSLTVIAIVVVWPVAFVALARTQSRAAFIALAVALCVFLLNRRRKKLLAHRRLAFLVAAGFIALVAYPGLIDTLSAQFLSHRTELDYGSSNQERTAALLGSLKLMFEYPLLGIGYGHFPSLAAGLPDLLDYVNTHNEYTRFGAELGITGLAILLIPLVSAIRSATGANGRNVLAVLLAMTAAMLAGNYLNSVVTAYPFWLALGMGLSMHEAARARKFDERNRMLGWAASDHLRPDLT